MEIQNEKEYLELFNKSNPTEEEKTAIKEYNMKLVTIFPFLEPVNCGTGEPLNHYDYSHTVLDCMPTGWRMAFGLQMCLDIRNQLINEDRLYLYKVLEVKEKWGGLRWYDNGCGNILFNILQKYENLSLRTCIRCGKPATYTSTGWISPFCEDCAKKLFEKDKQHYINDIVFENKFSPLKIN